MAPTTDLDPLEERRITERRMAEQRDWLVLFDRRQSQRRFEDEPSAHAMLVQTYRAALRLHDWECEHSDNPLVVRRGLAARRALRWWQERIDPDAAIWNEFAPREAHAGPASETQGEGKRWSDSTT